MKKTTEERVLAALLIAGTLTTAYHDKAVAALRAEEPCEECRGTGRKTCYSSSWNSDYPCKCDACDGTGKRKVIR